MNKNLKIIIIALSSAIVVALLVLAIVSITGSSDDADISTTATEETTETNNSTQENETQAQTTTQAATVSELIIGKWRDSANISGYEFYEDGRVDITYVDLTLPILNIPIEGTVTGSYTLSGDKLTIIYSLYTQTFDESYTVSIENNVMSLSSFGDLSTYSKVSETTEEATTETVVYEDDELTGSWVNSDGTIKYDFSEDGVVNIEITTGEYSGIYFIQDDVITIQFVVGTEIITETYTYVVSKNSMSLTNSLNVVSLWVRSGTENDTTSNDEDILGSWEDSTGMTGYTFNEGSIVDITYANFTIAVLNIPITGTYKGVYVVSNGKITMNYTISSQSYSYTYEFAVSGDTLTLTNTEDGSISTYTRVE